MTTNEMTNTLKELILDRTGYWIIDVQIMTTLPSPMVIGDDQLKWYSIENIHRLYSKEVEEYPALVYRKDCFSIKKDLKLIKRQYLLNYQNGNSNLIPQDRKSYEHSIKTRSELPSNFY